MLKVNKQEAIECLDLICKLSPSKETIQAFAKMIGVDDGCNYQQLHSHRDGVDLTSYADEDALQLEQRRLAGKNASALNGDYQQMREQRLALQAGLDASLLTGNWRQMNQQRLALLDGLDSTLLHGTWRQMFFQRLEERDNGQ